MSKSDAVIEALKLIEGRCRVLRGHYREIGNHYDVAYYDGQGVGVLIAMDILLADDPMRRQAKWTKFPWETE